MAALFRFLAQYALFFGLGCDLRDAGNDGGAISVAIRGVSGVSGKGEMAVFSWRLVNGRERASVGKIVRLRIELPVSSCHTAA